MFWFQFKQNLVFNTIHSYLRCGYIQRLNLIQKSNLIFYNNKLSIHVMIVLDSWLKIDKQIIAKYHVANQFNRNSCDLPKTRRLPMLYSTKKKYPYSCHETCYQTRQTSTYRIQMEAYIII